MMTKTVKLYFHYLMPKKLLTQFAGLLANTNITWLKNYLIAYFVKRHPVNMGEATESNPFAYASFNEFFTRHLKPGVRPIATERYVSPADGAISQFGQLHEHQILQAKGIDYSFKQLTLSTKNEAEPFLNGSFMTIYLSPKDYHRIHMPIAGKLIKQTYIPGQLFSVQPFTTDHIPNLFTQNERLVMHFETESGPLIMVMVGATIVGCIGTVWQGDLKRQSKVETIEWTSPIKLEKGDEVGYFKLGSTVIIAWPESSDPKWHKNFINGETIKLGQAIAN
jgi:phosphatidylserine decarboxylase